jgi:hypothetical protein
MSVMELCKIVKDEIARSKIFEDDYFTTAFHEKDVPKEKRLSDLRYGVRAETFPWLLQRFFEEHFAHLNGDPESRDMGEGLRVVVECIKLYRKSCNRALGAMSLVNPTPERVQACFDAGIPDVARDAFEIAIRDGNEEVIARLVESRDCARLLTYHCWVSRKPSPELEAKIILQSRDHFAQRVGEIFCDSVEAARALYEVGLLWKLDLHHFLAGRDYYLPGFQYSLYLDRLWFLHEYKDSLDIRKLMHTEPFLLLLWKEFPDIAATLPVLEFVESIQKPDGKFSSFTVDRIRSHLRISEPEANEWIAGMLTELEAQNQQVAPTD